MQTFTSFDGITLAHYCWGEPGGELPPVVLHHGFSTSAAANWKAPGIVDALVAAGRQVIAIDARGHGSSEKPHDPARYGEDKMARDLAALFDLLELDRVDLAGYSMGGVVALLTAAADDRVRRLVTGGIGAGAVEQGGVDRAALPGRALIDGLLADDPSGITDERVMGFRLFADASGADRKALAAQAQAGHRTPIALDRIKIPTLVLAGTDDWLATRPEVLAAALPDARWKVLSGDHLTVVRNPEFAAALVSFLA
ncbi:alpha/beta fold hydrolase [Catellatospora vulcania]|uniref:alpha/beta fold hydrolase n=1 Tax=Catellatospora vulcania TaxID=1460450 RepID=UPI0012D48878|nr:alpha/beta hydrolase [Catellatospora vulcania]